MRNYRNYFRSIMVALLGSAVFFASCKDDDVETKSAECSIVSFKVNNAEWTIDGTSITHTFSSDFLETNLTPTIEVSEGATVNPASGVAQNFFAESGVKYTVTAEDGKTTKTYTVKATITPSTACEVLEFKTISGRDTVKWVVSGNTITGVYPAGTDTSASLTPTIEISLGATVNPASGVAQKFFTEQGVTYTVTAGDGVTAKTYVAKATVALSTDCYILEFKIGSGAAWAITGDSLITFEYPAGTATENLTPAILISPDAAITPAAGVAQNFFAENGVAYTVTARDGVTTRTYVVKATVALYTGSDILSFVAGDSTWTINADNNTITVVYPTGTDLTALTPTITLSPGATVSPESGVAQDFSVEGGVKYTVTAQDGTVKEYTATATTTAALSSACDVTSFSVGDKTWTIDGTNITVEYPAGADLTALTPTITLSPGATVSPESGVAQDFSAADGVAYTVTAEDGTTTKIYTAKATVAAGPSSACDILSFVVDNEEWGIFEDQIYKPYPAGTEPFSSTPTIVLSEGATVSPESSVAQNFFAEDGVQYTVTAADGTTQKTYTVKATIAAPYVPTPYNPSEFGWVVLPRNGFHGWHTTPEDPAGTGDQDVWEGGHPMLAIDDDPKSGWHSFVHGETSLPQVLIIDMKEQLDVTTITATGAYFNKVEFYIADDVSAGVNGYYGHSVNWNDWPENRASDYLGWIDALKYNISDPAEWAGTQKIGETISEDGSSFSFTADYPGYGRYLIIKFPESRTETYIAVFDLKVYN